MTKPADFTECVGDELPVGWEQAYDYQRGIYYVDHINSKIIFFIDRFLNFFRLEQPRRSLRTQKKKFQKN